MLTMKKEMDARVKEGRPVRVGLVGTGKMGAALLAQLHCLGGIHPSLVVNRTPQKALDALLRSGYNRDDIVLFDDRSKQKQAFETGKIILSDNYDCAFDLPLDGIVDATGNPSMGAELASKTIDAHMDIIMLNVETDAVVGPILLEKAKKEGVIYTGSAGDEPGAIAELANFVTGNGFELLAVGKGKNNPLNYFITADDVREEALRKGLRPEMLVGFVDGTNTMIEMTAAGNALGFVPDVPGGHGATLNLKEMPGFYSLKEQGGQLSQYKIVDFCFGLAPGVYAIATTPSEDVRELLEYVSMGPGPNFCFHRPYHLTSLETPSSIYDAIVRKEATIAPEAGQVCDTISIAKRDIKQGESIQGIGSNDMYGQIVSHKQQQQEDAYPIALITPGTFTTCDIKKGTMITKDMVRHDEELLIHRLRTEQDKKEKMKGK